jgi:hypothetical protein
MKVLEGKELEEENDLYNMYFAEKSSDEDFNLEEESGAEDSFDSDFERANGQQEEEEPEEEEVDEGELLKKIKSGKRRKADEGVNIDLDEMDIDKIDQIELQKDMGIQIVMENEEETFKPKIKEKKKSNRKSKAFIDDDEDSYLRRKRKFVKPQVRKYKKQKVSDGDINKGDIQSDFENKGSEADKLKLEKLKSKDQTVKYSYLQDKPSQKDLLFEAIFTEIYNKKSLEEMQRLEDLNKRELTSSSKKQFNEYVRFFKTEKDIETIEKQNIDDPEKKSN